MKNHAPKGKFRYKQEHKSFLRDGYLSMSLRALTQAFNARFSTTRSEGHIHACLRNHSIRSGRTGRFELGCAPWNRGTKGYTVGNVTSFQPGHMTHNKKPLWSERVSRDGYIEISVPERDPHTGAATRYRHKHVWLWETEHGQVPKGSVVIFKDGDRRNCVLDNLLLVQRAELLTLNLHNYRETCKELKSSVLALAKLEAKAGIRTRPGAGRRKA